MSEKEKLITGGGNLVTGAANAASSGTSVSSTIYPTISPNTYPPTYYPPSAVPSFTWTNTVQVHPQKCVCGGNVKKETVSTKEKKVSIRDDRRKKFTIVSETRDALVCGNCGIIGWYGSGPSP